MNAQLLIGITITSIFLLILVFLLVRRTIVTTIEGFSWQRKVWLEHYIWVEESSDVGYPEGSRNQHSTTELYFSYEMTHYDSTTTNNADGTSSTTSTPVYEMVPRL